MRANRSEFNANAALAAPGTTYSAEQVAAMMRARDARQARERKARRAERFYMLATIAGLAVVVVVMFHRLTR